MNQEQELEFKKAAEEALESLCFRDEHGNFYTEIYADYRDELDDRSLKKLCNAEDPREQFYDWLDEVFALCVGLHLEPYLSYPLMKKANVTFSETKDGSDSSYRRAMLCCLFKESVPQICQYIDMQNARRDVFGIPELRLKN